MKREEESWDNEGGQMSTTSVRIRHISNAVLPYVVVLNHPGREATQHAFATMPEAEAFLKHNTPTFGRALSTLYDRPPS